MPQKKVSKEYSAFRLHRNGAIRRGIAFEFEFEEWCYWWEANLGPDWLMRRGRKRDQYVMARNGDTGPYAPQNVQCKTQSENAREQTKKRRVSKLTEEAVRDIYLTKGQRTLAKKYGVNLSTVKGIKRKTYWRDITDLLD